MIIDVTVTALSPLHLGSGKADVVIDAEVVHDKYGLPYLPAKRFKGVLYESALEVWEMSELSGAGFFSKQALDELFGKVPSRAQLIIHDLHLPGYEKLCVDWHYLQEKYKAVLTPEDVLEAYTDVRYQTKIDSKTGTAADSSLHNMRVVDAGIIFVGQLELIGASQEQQKLVGWALKNLHGIGAKRNRGFGRIECTAKGLPVQVEAATPRDANLAEGE